MPRGDASVTVHSIEELDALDLEASSVIAVERNGRLLLFELDDANEWWSTNHDGELDRDWLAHGAWVVWTPTAP